MSESDTSSVFCMPITWNFKSWHVAVASGVTSRPQDKSCALNCKVYVCSLMLQEFVIFLNLIFLETIEGT